MKVVLTHPYCWPYVRRGSERNVENVARYLLSRGHEVTTLSMHPERSTVEDNGSGRRVLSRPYKVPGMGLLHVDPTHTFFFPAYRGMRLLDANVVHSFFYTDALATACARGKRKFRLLFQMNGIAIPGISCRRFPPEAWLWRRALERVDVRITCSRFVGEQLREHYGWDYHAIAPPVNLDEFPLGQGPADQRPVILAVGDFTVPRKGVRVLVQAFRRLKESVKDALLRLSGRLPEDLQRELFGDLPESVRRDIEVLGLGKPGDVPAQYREASVMALPAMWEPSGTVMVEAWASGTPVVVADHAGLPEFLSKDVGRTFDPRSNGQETSNVEGLTEALLAGLDLAQQTGVRERCRAHAARYSTETIGPILEALYAG